MAIASLNINGLRSHLDEVRLLIRDLGIHILALNETKLNTESPKELTSVAGYQQERLERTCNGGGVSIYIRDSIKYKRRLDVPIDDLEIICIEVNPPKSKSFLVLAWYRPPSDPVVSFNKLEKVLSFFDKEGKEVILLGDTNCDLTPKQAEQPIDNNSKHLLGLYELSSFKQLVEEPTRVTLTTSSIIDHIATTRARNIVKSGVYEVSLSDHSMVYCIRKFNGAVEKGHKIIKTRKMKNFNVEAFLADVSGMCWEQMLTGTDDIDVLVSSWSSLFSLIIEKHAPMTVMRVSEKYCPWIDQDLKKLMQIRDKLKKAATKRKSQFLMDSYRQVRNKVNVLNIQLKQQYYTNMISACQSNMKESWKTINELLNKRSKSSNIDSLKESGSEIVHKKDISNAMNSFFCSIGKDLADKIHPAPNPLLAGDFEVNKHKARFNFRTIEVQEIRGAFATSTVRNAVSVMFWGCIGPSRVGNLVVCNKVNAEKYCSMLQDNLFQSSGKIYGMEEKAFIFQQDNATPHTAKHTKVYLKLRKVPLLPWPAQSPDINIIENIWLYMKRRINNNSATFPKTKDQLIARVQEEWSRIPESFLDKLYTSIPQRLKAVIKSRGYMTKY
eukprot:gene16541-18216_t